MLAQLVSAIAYLALLAIPVLAGEESSLAIIPVASQSAYSAKTVAVIVLANLDGLLLYRKRARQA